MTEDAHKERHKLLRRQLDELVADWVVNTKGFPSKATVFDLMEWADKQATQLDHKVNL